MLRQIDACACCNRWRNYSEAVTLFCLGLMACALTLPSPIGGFLVFCTTLASARLGAAIALSLFLRALLLPLGFLAVSALGLCLSLSWTDGLHLSLSSLGIQTAFRTSTRALAAISVTLLFACTVPLPAWLELLRRLRAPETLLDLFLLTYRCLFIFSDTGNSIVRAQEGRLGYSSFSRAMHSSAQAASALFVKALKQAGQMELGLAARNYGGAFRVLLPPSQTRRRHYLFALAVPLLLAALSVSWDLIHSAP